MPKLLGPYYRARDPLEIQEISSRKGALKKHQNLGGLVGKIYLVN